MYMSIVKGINHLALKKSEILGTYLLSYLQFHQVGHESKIKFQSIFVDKLFASTFSNRKMEV